jgi:hypothetical protein
MAAEQSHNLEDMSHAELVEILGQQRSLLTEMRSLLERPGNSRGSDAPASESQQQITVGDEGQTAEGDESTLNSDPASRVSEMQTRSSLRPLPSAIFFLALVLAALGEYVIRTQPSVWLGVIGYILAVVLLVWSAPRAVILPPVVLTETTGTYRWWSILGVGVIVTLGCSVAAWLALNEDLRAVSARWLWLVSLLVLMSMGVALARYEPQLERWKSALPRGRRWLWFAVLLVLVAAVLARFMWLDRVPWGINPDEGDRTANAMQILRGVTDRGIFETGWYRISMMYFYLLSGALRWLGIGFVQARMFTAAWGVLTVAAVMWIGLRHFGVRMGLAAGAVMASMGIALQFSRETSEAGPTAALWALSVTCFLEAVRSGRSWAWIGAGLTGGYSLYFYPTGRLWALFASGYCAYLLVRCLLTHESVRPLLRGILLAATAAIVITLPFFAQVAQFPNEFALRAQETSVLIGENAQRLSYFDPTWSVPRLLFEQMARSIGVLNYFADGGGFWPIHQPLLVPILALLALLGVGMSTLRWRDPRSMALSIWFWVGIAGMIVTVETPNVQRMATAVPALALLIGLAFDDLTGRLTRIVRSSKASEDSAPQRNFALWFANGVAVLLLAGGLIAEVRFYFRDYAAMNLWIGWNQEGRVANDLGSNTLVMSMGQAFHMINSGWVRLLAPTTARGGVQSPGSILPLPTDGEQNLAFYLYPDQQHYLPYMHDLYPTVQQTPYALPSEGEYFKLLLVDGSDVAETRGAYVSLQDQGVDAAPLRVVTLGAPPDESGVRYPANAVWTATVRVPQEWNYTWRVGPGPARLSIDGVPIIDAPASATVTKTVGLARGDHILRLEGVLTGADHGIDVAWAQSLPAAALEWRALTLDDLRATDDKPHGLYGVVEVAGRPAEHRLDNTLASCCMAGLVQSLGRPVRVSWTGGLEIPQAGAYGFSALTSSPFTLTIDGQPVLQLDAPEGGRVDGISTLTAGRHAVEIVYDAKNGNAGLLELLWTPPDGVTSIVPPSVLSPPDNAGVLPLLTDEQLATPMTFPVDQPLTVIE